MPHGLRESAVRFPKSGKNPLLPRRQAPSPGRNDRPGTGARRLESASLDGEAGERGRPYFGRLTVTLTILTGVFGRSLPSVGVFSILVITSMPFVILPNTGCFEGPGVNQSR